MLTTSYDLFLKPETAGNMLNDAEYHTIFAKEMQVPYVKDLFDFL
jgi:hypothetical protein